MEKDLKQISDNIEAIKANAEKAGVDSAKAVEMYNDLKASFESNSLSTKEDIDNFRNEMQKQFDELAAAKKDVKAEVKSFDDVYTESIENQFDTIQKDLARNKKAVLQLKDFNYKTMTLSGSLTGDPVASYAINQVLLPSQKTNFRDLIPTMQTPTGLYIQFGENAGAANNIAKQTEGAAKGENDYAFTEAKIVQQYIAGFSKFSKQMVTSLPWLQGTLPRLLLRDFFKKENSLFFATVSAAATGSTTTSETDDIKQLIDYIGNQKAANFNASYVLVGEVAMAALLKLTYVNGYYVGSGSVVTTPNGGMTIWGVPVISASWVTANKALVIDRDYLERVEVNGVSIEFSYEDSDNFQKNLVTARIECQEEINLMLPTSAIYATFTV
jgi:hypothetical protein